MTETRTKLILNLEVARNCLKRILDGEDWDLLRVAKDSFEFFSKNAKDQKMYDEDEIEMILNDSDDDGIDMDDLEEAIELLDGLINFTCDCRKRKGE